jgi:hypothetical protein
MYVGILLSEEARNPKVSRIGDWMATGPILIGTMFGFAFLISEYVGTMGPKVLWAAGQWWFAYLVVVLSYAFFMLRLRARSIYGVVEVLVGITAIFAAVSKPEDADLAHLIAVLGGAYIVVRGLDNINEGLINFTA